MATAVHEQVEPDGGPRAARAVPAARQDRFFLWLSLICAGIAIGGFMPTYWLQLWPATFRGPPIIHIHAALFTAWIFFLISQAWLVSRRRLRSHRAWGLAGIALASAVVIVGLATAISALHVELGRGYGDAARAFLVVPLAALLRFALFTGAAIACVNRPEWHKRLMLVGTISMIEAAAARIGFVLATGGGPGMRPGFFPPPPAMLPIVTGLVLQLLIVAGMIHDKRTRGAVHPAWIVGMVGSVAVMLLKVPLSTTPAWLAFAEWTTHLLG